MVQHLRARLWILRLTKLMTVSCSITLAVQVTLLMYDCTRLFSRNHTQISTTYAIGLFFTEVKSILQLNKSDCCCCCKIISEITHEFEFETGFLLIKLVSLLYGCVLYYSKSAAHSMFYSLTLNLTLILMPILMDARLPFCVPTNIQYPPNIDLTHLIQKS